MAGYMPDVELLRDVPGGVVPHPEFQKYSVGDFLTDRKTISMYVPEWFRGRHIGVDSSNGSQEFRVFDGARCLVSSGHSLPDQLVSVTGTTLDAPTGDSDISGVFLFFIPNNPANTSGVEYGANALGFSVRSNDIRCIFSVSGVSASESFVTIDKADLNQGINILIISQKENINGTVNVEISVNGIQKSNRVESGKIAAVNRPTAYGGSENGALAAAIYTNQYVNHSSALQVKSALWESIRNG